VASCFAGARFFAGFFAAFLAGARFFLVGTAFLAAARRFLVTAAFFFPEVFAFGLIGRLRREFMLWP
jgi:hypothetical protein